jgi:uncharacterized protein YjiS (DUF1127 family)
LNTSGAGNSPSSPTNGAYYYDKSPYADIRFPLDVWERAQAELALTDSIFRDIAREFSLQYLENKEGRYPWPSRGVMLPRSWSRTEIRISLNPLFLRDRRHFYVLERIRLPKYNWLPTRRHRREILAEYSVEALSDAAKIRADIEKVVREL